MRVSPVSECADSVQSEPATPTHPTHTPKLGHPDVPGEGGTPIGALPGGGVWCEAWWGEHDGARVAT